MSEDSVPYVHNDLVRRISEEIAKKMKEEPFGRLAQAWSSEGTELIADSSGMSEDQAIRAAAIQAAASSHAISQYGHVAADKDVIRTAVRYAYWIHTGEMPDA